FGVRDRPGQHQRRRHLGLSHQVPVVRRRAQPECHRHGAGTDHPVRGRSGAMRVRQRLLGLGALVVLAGIVVGLPALLLALGGNPLLGTLPSLEEVRDALLTPDDGTLALTGAKLLGWVVWAALSL